MIDLTTRTRIAVIDDEQVVADTLAEILKLHGYDAKPYYSGESAIEDMQEFRPNVVLSDIHMKKIDGIQTALRIREYQCDCRIILFTASPVHGAIYEKISSLGFEFLHRPLHPWEVLRLLRNSSQLHRALDIDPRRAVGLVAAPNDDSCRH